MAGFLDHFDDTDPCTENPLTRDEYAATVHGEDPDVMYALYKDLRDLNCGADVQPCYEVHGHRACLEFAFDGPDLNVVPIAGSVVGMASVIGVLLVMRVLKTCR